LVAALRAAGADTIRAVDKLRWHSGSSGSMTSTTEPRPARPGRLRRGVPGRRCGVQPGRRHGAWASLRATRPCACCRAHHNQVLNAATMPGAALLLLLLACVYRQSAGEFRRAALRELTRTGHARDGYGWRSSSGSGWRATSTRTSASRRAWLAITTCTDPRDVSRVSREGARSHLPQGGARQAQWCQLH